MSEIIDSDVLQDAAGRLRQATGRTGRARKVAVLETLLDVLDGMEPSEVPSTDDEGRHEDLERLRRRVDEGLRRRSQRVHERDDLVRQLDLLEGDLERIEREIRLLRQLEELRESWAEARQRLRHLMEDCQEERRLAEEVADLNEGLLGSVAEIRDCIEDYEKLDERADRLLRKHRRGTQ